MLRGQTDRNPKERVSMGATRIIGASGNPNSFGNMDVIVFPLAARTATVSSADIVNDFGSTCHVYIKVTARAGAASTTFTIEGKDAVSGDYYTILASTAMTTPAVKIMRVGPGLTASANLIVNDLLPRTWRVTATHGTADAHTYSVGASVLGGY